MATRFGTGLVGAVVLTPLLAGAALAAGQPLNYYSGNHLSNAYGGAPLVWNGTPATTKGHTGKPGDKAFAVGDAALAVTDPSVGNFGTDDFTIHLWLNYRLTAGPYQEIISKRDFCSAPASGPWSMFDLRASGQSGLLADLTDDVSPDFYIRHTTNVLDARWHEITFTRAGLELRLTVDGTTVNGTAARVVPLNNNTPFRLDDGGCVGQDGTTRGRGALDDISFGPGTAVIGPPRPTPTPAPRTTAKTSIAGAAATVPAATARPSPPAAPRHHIRSKPAPVAVPTPFAQPTPFVRVDPSTLSASSAIDGGSGDRNRTGAGAAVSYAAALPDPNDKVITDPAAIARSALLALLFLTLLALPIGIVNDTATANAARIAAALWRLRRIPAALTRGGPYVAGGVVVLQTVIGAVLFACLEPSIGWNLSSLALVLGQVLALAVITSASKLPVLAYLQRSGDGPGVLRLYPLFLLVAIACVAFSRISGLHPGLVLGTVVGVGASREPGPVVAGRSSAIGAATLGATGMVAWFARPGVSVDTFWSSVLDVALTTIAAAAAGTLAFGLLPLSFLAGHAILYWSRPAWAALSLAGAFAFVHVLLAAKAGDSVTERATYLGWMLGIYLLAALAFWGWFRLHPSPRVLPSELPPADASQPVRSTPGHRGAIRPSG